MQLWSKLTFLFLLIHLNLANLGYYDYEMPEALEGNGPEEFINLPLDFGAHQQLRVKPFPSRMDSLKYTFSRMGKYSRSLPYNGAKARKMPCCTETIGTHTCNELRNKRPLAFRKRCKVDADFAILQCCQTCRTNVAELGRELFAFGLKSRHCFDRHNRNYCSHFIHQSGMWAANAGKLVNCNGESASLAFRVCRRSCGFCDPELYEKPNRNCTKGSGVNPTVKGGKQGGEKTTEKTDKNIEQGTTTKNVFSPSSTPASSPGSIQTPQISTSKPPLPISSTTASPPTTPSKMPPSPKPRPPPSPSPPTAPPTLHPTVLPPTTPKLIPFPSPKPLPPLPQIPCQPIEPISPLTEPTISIPQVTPRPFAPNPPPPPPLPPIHPIMPPPHPFLPPHRPHPSLPGWPVHPILPRPIPRPRPRPPMPLPQRPPPKITIEWKPMPQPRGGGEVGPWPEWPWPFPDEVIEAILNQLSGVDDGHRVRGGIRGRRGEKEECGECILDEMGERREMEEEIKREKEHFDLGNLLGFGGEEKEEKNLEENSHENGLGDIVDLFQKYIQK